jgi:hypothetical protein
VERDKACRSRTTPCKHSNVLDRRAVLPLAVDATHAMAMEFSKVGADVLLTPSPECLGRMSYAAFVSSVSGLGSGKGAACRAWLKRQAAGRPLAPFHGTPNEFEVLKVVAPGRSFLMISASGVSLLLAVLAEQGVGLTCWVDDGLESVSLWLTQCVCTRQQQDSAVCGLFECAGGRIRVCMDLWNGYTLSTCCLGSDAVERLQMSVSKCRSAWQGAMGARTGARCCDYDKCALEGSSSGCYDLLVGDASLSCTEQRSAVGATDVFLVEKLEYSGLGEPLCG